MHQPFPNSPMENCDPKLCLGQGHFNNFLHNHMVRNQSSAVTSMANLEDVAALRRIQPLFFHQMASNNNSCAYMKQPVDTSGLKCPIVMMINPRQKQTEGTTRAVVVERSAARDVLCVQQAVGLERSAARDVPCVQQAVGLERGAARDVPCVQQAVGLERSAARDVPCVQQAVGLERSAARDIPCVQQTVGLDRRLLGRSDEPAANIDIHFVQARKAVHGFCHNDASRESTHRVSQHQLVPSSESHNFTISQNILCDNANNNNNEAQITEDDDVYFPNDMHQQAQCVQYHANPAAQFPRHPVHSQGQWPGRAGRNQYPRNHEGPPRGQRLEQYPHNQEGPPHGQRLEQYPHNQEGPPHGQRLEQYPHNHEVPSHGQQLEQYPHNHEGPPHIMDLVLYNEAQFQYSEPRKQVDGGVASNNVGFMIFNPVNDLHRPPHLPSQPPMLAATRSQYGHHYGGGQVPPQTQGRPATNQAVFTGNNIPDFRRGAAADHGCPRLPGIRRDYLRTANIRRGDRYNIQSYLLPGRILQVHGAPMAGKSTLVRQAISDAIFNSAQTGQLHDHHITCKGVARFSDFLNLIAQSWYPQYSHWLQQDTDSVLKLIGSFLQQNPLGHHVLVFHKCENLRENPHGQHFLEFLTRIVHELDMFSVSVVFTTYKYYWAPPRMSIGEVDVHVLSVTDIISLLEYYVPHLDDCVTYANVLVKTFCFPEAVRLIAEEYLAHRNCHVTPDQLEKIINKDQDFLSRLFETRLQEVDTWVSKKDLLFLEHFKHSIENSFTEAHLEYVNSSDSDQVPLQKTINHLKENHLVRSLPGIRRLVIHPLIVYHSMVSSSRDRQLLPEKWLENTCNRYTCFLGRVLMSIEANMQEHGRKGLVFAGLIQEGPNIRYVFQMALHCCNVNTYQNFIKVALTASSYILKIFPREAEAFYWSLYNSAKTYGSPEEFAVMEAFLGQAIAEGTGISEGK